MVQGVDNLPLYVDNSSPDEIWDRCLKIIKENVNPQSFQTWFLPIRPLKIEGNQMIIQVPSQFFYEWLEEHYPRILRMALSEGLGEESVPVYRMLPKETSPDK